jgi:hypothetical protein
LKIVTAGAQVRASVAIMGPLPEDVIADSESVQATYAADMQPCDRHDPSVSERPRTAGGPVSEEKSLFGEFGERPRTLANMDYC